MIASMDLKCIFFAFYATICLFDFIVCETIVVETHSGPVKGSVIVFNKHKINQFLGIPYAEPPIGVNRFGKPKPVQKWTQTVDATHVKNICWQSSAAKAQTHIQSENCLLLNIWSENKNDTKLRAVMFYIHGGGLHDGNGYIDGMSLTSYGVVMVSINYRVGPFGFLYGDEPSVSGNVGIYDQVLALKWVNNNIEHFGGDPKQITIFGQSAGSWSVSALIVSPLSINLFKRAVMESGAYFFKNYRDYNNSNRLAEAHKTAHSIGCANDTKWLDCLRKAEPTEIVKHNSVSPSLVFDNELLPYRLEDAVKLGKFKTGMHSMIQNLIFNCSQINNYCFKKDLKAETLSGSH
jgi:carboxylesterase type B